MNSKYFINENQKNQTEANIKIKQLNEKNNYGTIYFTKRMPFYKYLLNKKLKLKLSNNNKTSSREKKTISYQKREKISLLNINNSSDNEKKSIYSYNTIKIKNQESNEKEKVILDLLRLKKEIDEKNQELNLLKNEYNKLQDNNLTYQTIIEKILLIIEGNNEKTKENDLKFVKSSLNKKKINMLKLQIVNYDKKIEKQKSVLNEAKKEKKITNFINVNKLINNKNQELEKLVLESQQIQKFHNNMDNMVDFYNYSIKKYKDINLGLKVKIEINKRQKKFKEKQIETIKNEILETKEKIDKFEKELNSLEQNNINKKDELKNLINEYEKNKDLKEEKKKYENKINNFNFLDNEFKLILERNERKINKIKNNNINMENKLPILKEEIEKLKEKEKQKEIGKRNIKDYEKKIKEVKEDIEKNKKEASRRQLKEKTEKEIIKKEIKEFEKAKINLINKIKELNKELEEKTKESTKKEKELERTNQEYNIIIKQKNS